jgi:hypothetical protein
MTTQNGFTPISEVIPLVLKETARRADLRPRIEAELGRSLNDNEFLQEPNKMVSTYDY